MPTKKTPTSTTAANRSPSSSVAKKKAAASRPLKAVANQPTTAEAETTADSTTGDAPFQVTIPFTGWHLTIPQVPEVITIPVLNFELTPPERESAAYYLVLGGLVAVEIIDWPLGVLLVTGHILARQHHYRALEGAAEALEAG